MLKKKCFRMALGKPGLSFGGFRFWVVRPGLRNTHSLASGGCQECGLDSSRAASNHSTALYLGGSQEQSRTVVIGRRRVYVH
jgi:hypothetical protein